MRVKYIKDYFSFFVRGDNMDLSHRNIEYLFFRQMKEFTKR